ncbi:thioredoxin family protein [Maritalea porphyrae]|mgnify:CR=1 FL=1|jgi:hypothetical protein|uniref:DUF1223 domain-containing protein n=1 Tax=Maritalea porphyrae TaxID=880732 RepID=UPI0022AE5D72|nr:DUF1223 domain-containing protein [Maritalea porphyrae]MCZ4272319.1 DUF1223 domain-containing protein [Maritalea porphyrae]
MKNIISKIALLASMVVGGVAPVKAMDVKGQPIAVLELFTSQGCSSCPPADEILAELAKDKNLITLAYHVDYWNYIGWEDTFSQKEHSELQRRYARQRNEKQVYTPQLLINGTVDVVGSHLDEIKEATANAKLDVIVNLHAEGDMLSINIPSAEIAVKDATIWLVPFVSKAQVKIERGENRGQLITYSSIVQKRQLVGMWSSKKATELRIPMPQMMNEGVDGLAVLVQERAPNGLPGRMLGAVSLLR